MPNCYNLKKAIAATFLLLVAFAGMGCAVLRFEGGHEPEETNLPWNRPAEWENQMPMGVPY